MVIRLWHKFVHFQIVVCMMTGHLHFVQDRVQGRMVLAKRLQIGGCDAISDNGALMHLTPVFYQKSDLPAMSRR